MASAGTVTVDFAAETARFNSELQKVSKSLKGVEGSFGSLARVAANAVGIFSVGAFTAFVKNAAEAADTLGKTADKLGLTTKALRSFQLAATEAGVDTATATKLLTDSQKRLGEAAAGTGEAAKFIKLLGLNVKELQQLTPDELFKRYADAINGLGTTSERFAAANALFGKSASQAFSLIAAGSPALEDAAAFVERFGLALDRISIKQIEAANDIMGRLGAVSQAAGQRIAAGLAPAIEFFSNQILDATGNTKDLQEAAEKFSAVAIVAFEVVANAARSLQAAFFGIAAGAARVLQFLTFGDVSQSFAASVDANLAKANEALSKIKSIEEIQAIVVKALEDSRQKAEAAVAAETAARGAGTGSFGDTIGLTDEQRADLQNDLNALDLFARQASEFNRQLTANVKEHFAEIQKAASAYVALRIRSEQAVQEAQTRALDAGLSALQQFAGKSKAAAIAFIAINKARALAAAIQNTAQGATAALALGPAGIPLAATIKALGGVEIAAIIASGFGEIQQVNSSATGGAPLGSPANPVNTLANSAGKSEQLGATSQTSVQVIIQGNVVGNQEFIDDLISDIRDAVDDRDVVLIRPTSRNAKEIIGAT